MRILPLLFLAVFSLASLSSCDGEGVVSIVDDEPRPNTDTPSAGDGDEPGSTSYTVVSEADYFSSNLGSAATSKLISYQMPGINGGVVEANAVVLTPAGPAPSGGFPLIAWAHGTTGIADICAPSALENLAGDAAYIEQYLQNGYAVIAPDYEGLGADGPHAYLHLASAGQSIIYAVSTAARYYSQLSNRYAVIGHSQGGHAALAAGQYAGQVSDVSLTGIIAIAPPSHIRDQYYKLAAIIADQEINIEQRVEVATRQLLFSALVISSIPIVEPDFDIGTMYGNNGITLRTGIETQCVRDVASDLLDPVSGALFISNNVDSIIVANAPDVAEFAAYLASNEPGTGAVDVPVLLLQGLQDTTVYPEYTSALHNRMAAVNIDSTLVEYESANHGSVLFEGLQDALNFLGTLF